MNLDEAVTRACQEKTLAEALSWIAVWETERIVKQAEGNLGKPEREWNTSHGGRWDTFWEYIFAKVLKAWAAQTPLPLEPDEPPHVLRTAIIVSAIVCTVAALIALAVIALR